MTDRLTPREFVLQRVENRTDIDGEAAQDADGGLWTGRRPIVDVGKRDNYPYTEDELQDAWDDLRADGEIFTWHGLTAPADRDHLLRIIEVETEARITRKILIGNINTFLASADI